MNETVDDSALLVAARDDVDAFTEIYQRHVDAVSNYVVRRCWNAQDAADLVASTFLEAIRSLDSYDSNKGKPLVWLLGIAHRVMSQDARHKGRDFRLQVKLSGFASLNAEETEQLESRIDAMRLYAELESALHGMPIQQREALMLVSYDNLSLADAARVQGVHPAAFRMRLSRARRSLRARLDKSRDAEPPGPALNSQMQLLAGQTQ